MRFDQFFTPADVCAVAYSSWESTSDGIRIGDFACGNGALLELAPFPNKTVYGMDIDSEVIESLKTQHDKWSLHSGDFLYPDDSAAQFLDPIRGSLDLVVLNPPFSCRGGSRVEIAHNQSVLNCSTAMAFLVRSLDFVSPGGSAMAIMPRSVLKSEKDALALGLVRENWIIDIREEFPRTTFYGCHPHSCCLSLRRQTTKAAHCSRPIHRAISQRGKQVRLIRGCLPMYETGPRGQYATLHTTELRQTDPMSSISRFSSRAGRTISGSFVTVPRVGAPDSRKIRALVAHTPVSLSDCVIALQPPDNRVTELLDDILSSWENLETLYASTCAPYITVSQLSSFLSSIGWEVLDGIDSQGLSSGLSKVSPTGWKTAVS